MEERTETNGAQAPAVYSFDDAAIRWTKDEQGRPMAVASDLAKAMGYKDAPDAVKRHCKGSVKRRPLLTSGGVQTLRVIYEPDIYRLIIGSKLPAAERFERWVFEEVLPAIRATGQYRAPETKPSMEAAHEAAQRQKLAVAMIERDLRMLRRVGLPLAKARMEAIDRAFAATGLDYSACIPSPAETVVEDGVVRAFIDQHCVLGSGLRIATEDLHRAYCERMPEGHRLGRNTFYRLLMQTEASVRRSRIDEDGGRPIAFIGITLSERVVPGEVPPVETVTRIY